MTNYCVTNSSALEKKVNNIFQATSESMSHRKRLSANVEAVLATTTYRLSRQRKNDFKLREDDTALTNLQTEVRKAVFVVLIFSLVAV